MVWYRIQHIYNLVEYTNIYYQIYCNTVYSIV